MVVGFIIQMVIQSFATKVIAFEVELLEFYAIIFLLPHHDNVLIIFFHTCRSTQLNMNRRMHKQECIQSSISKMRMHFVRN